jgi:hypothetical protein
MGIAELEPRQLAPTVGTTGAGSTDSPVPSTLQQIRSIAKIFDSADVVFNATANMIFKFAIKIFEFTITANMIFKFAIKIFEFAIAIMAFDSADMVFVAAVTKRFDLLIDKKFDPGV